MAIADVGQRPGLILAGAVALHVVLISLQVTTGAGTTVFHTVAFGSFSEVQRAATGVVGGVRDTWNGYVGLRQVRAENQSLRAQLGAMQVRTRVIAPRRNRGPSSFITAGHPPA